MEEAKSVVPSGVYGIPKWIMKKGMRYEVDDFIVSPPSHEDGEFLRLRYGRNRDQDTAQQEAGQDGGMTVEVRDDTLQFSNTPPTTTTISIGPGGLSVESSPLTTPETATETSDVHPLLVLPMNFGGASKEPAKEAPTITTTTVSQHTSLPAVAHDTSTLFEKVQALSLITSPSQSIEPSPVTSPHLSPRTSPLAQRRFGGLAMESRRKISAHSYFCTKQFQDPQRDAAGNVNLREERGLSLETNMRAAQLEEGAIAQHALDAKMMGRKRRQPKPSTLREMNFWAPTSM
ncbi:uncharacterized protein LOC126993951 isoform X2 [Eriocheir sinensis]|uniref:uncharacterized protein LOC126993951 isoform X2 n=1 Tax=Eriocheir sinensis TaxID=95602 RepID=UPI0021C71C91|nr:uncharacterized protein LOC126993951 isoform X2 [Eriocheir sinensis]